MIDFNFDKYCCGCSACFNECPVNAIEMQANREGFLMPVVDTSVCVNCGRCDKACPYLNCQSSESSIEEAKAYLYYYLDEDVRKRSASGAAFYALALSTIEKGGYVCGCVWNDNLEAEHIVSNSLDSIERMQSSKYVQSKIGNCYNEIKVLLEKRIQVLFSGTPCQVAGLKSYLDKEYNNLLTASIICHGTPSPEVWKRYKNALEDRYKSNMINVNMRDKSKYGYKKSVCRYEFENGKVIEWETYLRDIYCFSFTDDLFIRNSCLTCKYKGDNSKADIILGDYHKGVDGSDNKGSSLVLCLNKAGEMALMQLKDSRLIEFKNKEEIKSNNMLYNPTEGNVNREKFFSEYKTMDIIKCINRYLPTRFWIKVFFNKLGIFKALKSIKDKLSF